MQWATPIWLIGLGPWALLAIWLCLGQLTRSGVPFLPLWQGSTLQRKSKRQWQWPPPTIVCALAATLLALLAAARPFSNRLGGSITVILDRGVSMSADHQGQPRFVEAAERLAMHLSNDASVQLLDPLSGETAQVDGGAWMDTVRARSRTAIDTKTLLPLVIGRELAQGEGPIIVLTDQVAGIENPRLIVVQPADQVRDVGITTVVARAQPTTQVMVTVRNQSTLRQTVLSVRSGERAMEKSIELPLLGQPANYFFDMPSLGDVVEARLSMQDDLVADDAAWLVRGVQPMRLEVRGLVGNDLQRLVEIYSRVKPPGVESPIAAVVNRADQLGAGDAGVIVPLPDHVLPAGELKVISDPLTRLVNWNSAAQRANVSKPAEGDWTPLVTVGDTVIVAKRESPGRQVWVGFSKDAWPQSADFVVFWTNVLDWIAGDVTQWTAEPVKQISAAWKPATPLPAHVQANAWPGVYRNGETQMAMNCVVPIFRNAATPSPVTFHLAPGSHDHSWSSYLLFAAIGCGILAVAMMPRR